MMLPEPVAAVPFEEFIEHLRRNGFVIGVDSYLRIQELLDRLGGSYGPADLKTLVCPLVARTEDEQEAFYAAFARFYPEFEMQPDRAGVAIAVRTMLAPTAHSNRKWIWISAAIASVLISAALFAWKTLRTIDPPSVPDTNAIQTIPQVPLTTPIQFPSAPVDWFHRLGGWRILIPALTLLSWLALELMFRRRRKLILARRQGLKPPSTWPLRTESQPFSFRADALFHSVSRRLQDRKPGPVERIDIPRSVQATIRSFGFPVFLNQQATQIPEYIVLIDRSTRQDHQAQFFSDLVDSLEQEGILIRHYYFDDDPRECWSASGTERFSLSDLPSGSEHRLLLCTVGSRLVDPFTGQLANWVDLLERWPERAILTPVPVSEWGSPERKLASSTIVLPGNLRGVHALVDHLETEQSRELALVRNMSAVSELSSNESAGQQVFQLQKYLRTDVFTWFCACAVYPELHWDLTLEIAALPSMPPGLLNEDNLLTLVRMPWFRAGYMADDLRLMLMTHLTGEQERDVRRCILRLIGSNPAPDNTLARERQQQEAGSSHAWLVASTGGTLVDGSSGKGYVALSSVTPREISRLDLILSRRFRKSMKSKLYAAWNDIKAPIARVASFVRTQLGHVLPSRQYALAMGVAFSLLIGLGGITLLQRKNAAPPPSAEVAGMNVATVPPGARIQINGEERCIAPCKLQLPSGDYRLQAQLEGYDPTLSLHTLSAGQPPVEVTMTLTSQAQSLRIFSDIAGKIRIDGREQGDITEGSFILDRVPAGPHTVAIYGADGADASFAFEVTPGKAPAIKGATTAHNLLAVVISSAGHFAQIQASNGPLKTQLDGKDLSPFTTSRTEFRDFPEGDHELVLGEGNNGKTIQVSFLPTPTLTAYLRSDVNAGTLAVVTNPPEDDVMVFINGRLLRKTSRGQLRAQLAPGAVNVRVAKDGFENVAEQAAVVKKGEDTRLEFKLRSLPRAATLRIRSATSGATVFLDGREIGKVNAEGGFQTGGVAPGDHEIEFRMVDYLNIKTNKTFKAGETIEVANISLAKALGVIALVIAPSDTRVTYHQKNEPEQLATGGSINSLVPGRYVVTGKALGYKDKQVPVTVFGGQTATVDISLIPESLSQRPSERYPILFEGTPSGVSITVDNDVSSSCTSPCTILLQLGSHRLNAVLDGFTSVGVSFQVRGATSIPLNLSEAVGFLVVTSVPPGAKLMLNGVARPEKTPARLRLKPGTYKVIVISQNGDRDTPTAVVKDGVTLTLVVKFE